MSDHFIERKAIERWNHNGVECAISPSPMGGMNGYIQIPKDARQSSGPPSPEHHWLSAEDLEDSLHCHGGITYGPDEEGWLGFDTGHAGDLWPEHIVEEWKDPTIWPTGVKDLYAIQREYRQPWTIDWTFEKLREEVKNLAEQVHSLRQ